MGFIFLCCLVMHLGGGFHRGVGEEFSSKLFYHMHAVVGEGGQDILLAGIRVAKNDLLGPFLSSL